MAQPGRRKLLTDSACSCRVPLINAVKKRGTQETTMTSAAKRGSTPTSAFRADFLGEVDASAAAAQAGVWTVEALPSG